MNQDKHSRHEHGDSRRNYAMFGLNMAVSLVAMYFVMFSMIDGWADFRNNSTCCTWH